MKTKFVFKIEYYYEDTNQIDVRVGRSTSKSINDCRKVTVDLEKLDLNGEPLICSNSSFSF